LQTRLRLVSTRSPAAFFSSFDLSGFDTSQFETKNERVPLQSKYEYDLAVVGGGSGGLAAAKEAANCGARVILFDYVEPSTQGNSWGVGGTCINVGCVPKKLMHHAAICGELFQDARKFGWELSPSSNAKPAFHWAELVETVVNHVRSLSFSSSSALSKAGVKYVNAYAAFESPHTLRYDSRNDSFLSEAGKSTVSAANILVATGTRPIVPTDVEGAIEHSITSDDIFWDKKVPGKTLCVGSGYISLETAGILNSLGFDTTVAMRSNEILRSFDSDCAAKVFDLMNDVGIRFFREKIPKRIDKGANGTLHVTFEGEEEAEEYDTVLYAIGREACTSGLELHRAGVGTTENGKIVCDDKDRTNVPHIYAVGDVVESRPELTPVAVQCGRYLSRRLFNGSTETMDYDGLKVPTAVFTPFEYGCVGESEDTAETVYGKNNVDCFLWSWKSLELEASNRLKHESIDEGSYEPISPNCFAKLICLKSEGNRIVGFHFVGPNAGEVLQGFSLALNLGATKSDFDKMSKSPFGSIHFHSINRLTNIFTFFLTHSLL
jgi:thioredoxin reductase (NADPH)